HSVVHRHRPDAHCVMHTHTTSGMAVACKAEGLRHDNFYSAQLHGRIAYHPFEGVTTNPDEGPRIAASLADKDVLILRNHGLLALGPTLPAAFSLLWTLQRGCDVQLAADSLRGVNQPIEPAVLAAIPAQCAPMQAGAAPGQLMFEGILRRAGIVLADLAA
ncbi:MAG: class II aldolase/adducin family protein, partial [Burkholderiaceae bacterium]|nr:class II aldolase/adducin family protein [Burkholderiaceae bacterium]